MKHIEHFLEDYEFVKLKLMTLKLPWFMNHDTDENLCFTHQFYYNMNESLKFNELYRFKELLKIKVPIHIFGRLYLDTGDTVTHNNKSWLEKPASTAIYFINTCNTHIELDGEEKIFAVENNLLMFDGTRDYKIVQNADTTAFHSITFNYF
jgi:hypothetical protein